jgi:DNA (cytosine-5)-methyltransferase 1
MKTEKPLTLGSLFDGSGGFPLGGLLAGYHSCVGFGDRTVSHTSDHKAPAFYEALRETSPLWTAAGSNPWTSSPSAVPCQDMSVAGRSRTGLGRKAFKSFL